MRIAALLLCVLPLLACGTPVPAGPAAAKSSLQLIAEAHERGEIDEDTATLYRVYAVTDDSKLPPRYRGTRPMKDGTSVLRDARSRYDQLPPEIQKALKPYLFPRGER